MAQAEVFFDEFLEAALVAHIDEHRAEDVAERIAGGAGHTTGDVGHAVVDHTVFLEHRIGVRGNAAGLETTAAINAHIHYHCAALHALHHVRGYHHGRAAVLGPQRADDHIGVAKGLLQFIGLYYAGVDARGQIALHTAQAVDALIEDLHTSTQTQSGTRGELAHRASAEDHHFRRGHTADAAEHEAGTTFVGAHILAGDEDGGVACDLAHGADDRVDALAVLDEIPRHGMHPFLHQVLQRILRLHGKLQGTDEQLFRPQHGHLRFAGRGHLQDDVGLEHFERTVHEHGAGLGVIAVLELHRHAGAALHHNIVTATGEHRHGGRCKGHAVLLEGDFLRDADEEVLLLAPRGDHLLLREHGHLAGQLPDDVAVDRHDRRVKIRSSPSTAMLMCTVPAGSRSTASSGHSTKQYASLSMYSVKPMPSSSRGSRRRNRSKW